jgi:hypothetical protein
MGCDHKGTKSLVVRQAQDLQMTEEPMTPVGLD